LVKSICYLEEFALQTNWGQKQGKVARELYIKLSTTQHVVTDRGLVINQQWPYIGASPDDIVD